jgi:hypothetical protein
MFVGEVLGGNDRYVSPAGDRFRGVKIRMAGGSVEWKDRSAVAAGEWYVRRNDPALTRRDWEIFDY